jgi:GNAT superfamily N-acetyltransferase
VASSVVVSWAAGAGFDTHHRGAGDSDERLLTLSIRPWTEEDIPYVFQSVSREQWGHSRRDIESCWRWETNGCLIAEEGKKLGHLSTIAYGKLGWIGLLIVDPEQRGKGIGTALMERAIIHLRDTGVETIKLEAVEEVVPFYERLGFRQEFASLRYRGRMSVATTEPSEARISLVQPEDMAELEAFDSDIFGAGRTRVLRTLVERDHHHCFTARREGLLGYLMCRRTEIGYWMGPWVASDASASEELLVAALKSFDQPNPILRFGFPSPNEEMQKLMRKMGIPRRGKSIRMVLGNEACRGNAERIFGIAGPEKG